MVNLVRRWWHGRSSEPGAALFRGLQLRLTLWYSGVLVVALMACGLVLNFGLTDLTISQVNAQLRPWAEFETQDWQRDPGHSCGQNERSPGLRPGSDVRRPPPVPIYQACMTTDGQVLGAVFPGPGSGIVVPQAFLDTSLVRDALQNGSASDIIDSHEEAGPVLRLAVAVSDPSTGENMGVVQVGQSVAPQWDTLQLLRALLLLLIALATLGSIAGGLLLADRALEPARLAFARQQAFIADASHQLRTPLTLLRADAEVLLRHRERLDAGDAELLEDVVAETTHMDRLTTDLLILARLDAKHPHLEQEVIDLSELAAGLSQRVTTLAAEKGLTLKEDLDVHPVIFGDRQAVEQAALILVDNAIKYTPAGGEVTLRTAAVDHQAQLIVDDTGLGIPADHLERIGERFYRGDADQTGNADGTGLGLAIAFRIAAAHGGKVELSSRPGQGTRAVLSLSTSGPKG